MFFCFPFYYYIRFDNHPILQVLSILIRKVRGDNRFDPKIHLLTCISYDLLTKTKTFLSELAKISPTLLLLSYANGFFPFLVQLIGISQLLSRQLKNSYYPITK